MTSISSCEHFTRTRTHYIIIQKHWPFCTIYRKCRFEPFFLCVRDANISTKHWISFSALLVLNEYYSARSSSPILLAWTQLNTKVVCNQVQCGCFFSLCTETFKTLISPHHNFELDYRFHKIASKHTHTHKHTLRFRNN